MIVIKSSLIPSIQPTVSTQNTTDLWFDNTNITINAIKWHITDAYHSPIIYKPVYRLKGSTTIQSLINVYTGWKTVQVNDTGDNISIAIHAIKQYIIEIVLHSTSTFEVGFKTIYNPVYQIERPHMHSKSNQSVDWVENHSCKQILPHNKCEQHIEA